MHRKRRTAIEVKQPAEGAALPLPYDLFVDDVLTRLPPRDLAVARGVRRSWRAAIDGSRLLRADLLPLSVGGIFIDFNDHRFPEYFSNPSTSPTIPSMLDYLLDSIKTTRISITGHCNGLLLLDGDYVVNPAKRWWARVPPHLHTLEEHFNYWNYLVFDPTLSSHYEVFSVPHLYGDGVDEDELDPTIEEFDEWPPSSCILQVFSSTTNGWEGRSLIRDGEAAGTVSNMRKDVVQPDRYVYYKGVLYVQCQTNFVMRISLSDSKYQAIKPPPGIEDPHLGKSKHGIYFASLGYPDDGCRLRIWVLNESAGQAEWMLKCHADLTCVLHQNFSILPPGSWVLQDVNYNLQRDLFSNDKNEEHTEEKEIWDFENDKSYDDWGSFMFLGFHPFEEVVFLSQSLNWGLAYDLNSLKAEYLGYLYPTKYGYFAEVSKEIMASYPYTPCWM